MNDKSPKGSGGGLSLPVEPSLIANNRGREGPPREMVTPGESWEDTRGHEPPDRRRAQSLPPHGDPDLSHLSSPLLPLSAEPSEHKGRFW